MCNEVQTGHLGAGPPAAKALVHMKKKNESKKQPKSVRSKTMEISLDQMRAVVGGAAAAEEQRK